jgi:SAM-dependent methyltransferase
LEGDRVIDGYAGAAQYYDLLHAERIAACVREVLEALGSGARRGVLDLGAGTGASTAEIARLIPDTPITAIEPSMGMRTALYARLVADPKLRARTTVLPQTAERFSLPDLVDLVFCLDTSPAFPPPYRPDIWASLREAIAPGGVLLLDLPELDEPKVHPVVEIGRAEIGTLTLVGSRRGETAGQRQWWEYRYLLTDSDGEVVADDVTELYSWPVTAEELRTELTDAGFELGEDIPAAGKTILRAQRP